MDRQTDDHIMPIADVAVRSANSNNNNNNNNNNNTDNNPTECRNKCLCSEKMSHCTASSSSLCRCTGRPVIRCTWLNGSESTWWACQVTTAPVEHPSNNTVQQPYIISGGSRISKRGGPRSIKGWVWGRVSHPHWWSGLCPLGPHQKIFSNEFRCPIFDLWCIMATFFQYG